MRALVGLAVGLVACGGHGGAPPDGSTVDSTVDAMRVPDARLPDALMPADAAPDALSDAALAPPIPDAPDAGPLAACAPGIDAGPPLDGSPVFLASCCDDGDGGLTLPAHFGGGVGGIVASTDRDSRGDMHAWTWDGDATGLIDLGPNVRDAWADSDFLFGELVDEGDPTSSSLYVGSDLVHIADGVTKAIPGLFTITYQLEDGSVWLTGGLELASSVDWFDVVEPEGWAVWMTGWDGTKGNLYLSDGRPGILLSDRANRFVGDFDDFFWEDWDPSDPLPNGTLKASVDAVTVARHVLGRIALDDASYDVALWTVEHLADGEHLVIGSGAFGFDVGLAKPVDLRMNDGLATFAIDDGREERLYARGALLATEPDPGRLDWSASSAYVAVLHPSGEIDLVPSGGGTATLLTTDGALTQDPLAYMAKGALHEVDPSSGCTDVVLAPALDGPPVFNHGLFWKTPSGDLFLRDGGRTTHIASQVRDWFTTGNDQVFFESTSAGPAFYSMSR